MHGGFRRPVVQLFPGRAGVPQEAGSGHVVRTHEARELAAGVGYEELVGRLVAGARVPGVRVGSAV